MRNILETNFSQFVSSLNDNSELIRIHERDLTPLLRIASKYSTVEDFRKSYPDYGGGIDERYIIVNKKISNLKSTDSPDNLKPDRLTQLENSENPMPIVKGNIILDGHHRIEIAKRKGLDVIKVMQISNNGFSVKDIWNYAQKYYKERTNFIAIVSESANIEQIAKILTDMGCNIIDVHSEAGIISGTAVGNLNKFKIDGIIQISEDKPVKASKN